MAPKTGKKIKKKLKNKNPIAWKKWFG